MWFALCSIYMKKKKDLEKKGYENTSEFSKIGLKSHNI